MDAAGGSKPADSTSSSSTDEEPPVPSSKTLVEDSTGPKAIEDDPNGPKANKNYHGCVVKSVPEQEENEVGSSDNEDDDNAPGADIVHVAALCPDESFHETSHLLSVETRYQAREIVFRLDMSNLLVGNLTQMCIEQQAIQLLNGLVALKQEPLSSKADAKPKRRALIFVAYDFGALVVKTALSFAARFGTKYSDIFHDTARVVFSGCIQRSPNPRSMEMKLLELLGQKKDETWFHLFDTIDIRGIADCILQTNCMFINSKITLRIWTISIYANEKSSGRINSAIDRFTGSLGIPEEILIQEQVGDNIFSDDERFPLLCKHVSHHARNWIPHRNWIPIEKALLSISPAHRQYYPESLCLSFKAISTNETYVQWTRSMFPQLLYLHGALPQQTHQVADQIYLSWSGKQQDLCSETLYAKVHSFTFDRTDPLRNSISAMLASISMQAFAGYATGSTGDEYHILHDLWLFHGGWSRESLIALLYLLQPYMSGNGAVLLLQDFDECCQEDREIFLKYLKERSEKSEEQLKVLVTSRKAHALVGELDNWLTINVDDLPDELQEVKVSDQTYGSNFIIKEDSDIHDIACQLTQFCPLESEKKRISDNLTNLTPMNKTTFCKVVKLLQDHTGWPTDPSTQALIKFSNLLSQITPDDSLEKVLDRILRSCGDADGIRWVMNWLLRSYRPLTHSELTTSFLHRGFQRNCGRDLYKHQSSDPITIEATWCKIESWIRAICHLSNNEVTIKSEIRDLFKVDTEIERYIWNEGGSSSAHQILAEFCIAYVTSPSAQDLLNTFVKDYESKAIPQDLASPVLPDGEDLIFYAVQALPYHLSKSSGNASITAVKVLQQEQEKKALDIWAKAYWAMSNPFSRMVQAPESALHMFINLEHLSCEDIIKLTDDQSRAQCLVAAAGSEKDDLVTELLQKGKFPTIALTSALVEAIKSGHESVALELVNKILSLQLENEESTHVWPESVIWAAAWLNMHQLVERLLSIKMSPDPQENEARTLKVKSPSPLYIASRLGYTSTVRLFLNHDAKVKLGTNDHQYGCVQAAAHRGEVSVLGEFVAKDRSHVIDQWPNSPLSIAIRHGSWLVVAFLLKYEEVDPNQTESGPDGQRGSWTPLVAACYSGFPQCTKILLNNKAEVDHYGPYDVDTALWFASARNPNIECVNHLLEHGADPNHENLRPPLLLELMRTDEDPDVTISICNRLVNNDLPIKLDIVGGWREENALITAARYEKLPFVRWLLDQGQRTDIDRQDWFDQNALGYAVENNNLAVAKELLRGRPKLNIVTRNGRSLLHAALLLKPGTEMLELLLDAGADPEFTGSEDSKGSTLLNFAVIEGREDVVKMLIERKVNIHNESKDGWTPICDAVGVITSAAIVRLLVDAGANPKDTVGDSNLIHLSLAGPPEVLKILLEYGKLIDLDYRDNRGQTPLLAARRSSNIECLKLLIRAGANVNVHDNNGYTSLLVAMVYDKDDYFDLLMSQPEIDVNIMTPRWSGALHNACVFLQLEKVITLLDRGADVNATLSCNIYTPLINTFLANVDYRSESDYLSKVDQVVQTLVRYGANVNQTINGSKYYTAISAACFGSGTSAINYLIEEGASIQEAHPGSGRLPLHFAAANGIGNFRAVMFSYKNFSAHDLLSKDCTGKNCLHWAAQFGKLKTLEFILSKLSSNPSDWKRYIDIADNDGWTPLCWAMRSGNPDSRGLASETPDIIGTIKSLIKHGANLEVRCWIGNKEGSEGFTPLALAELFQAGQEIIKLLKESMKAAAPTSTKSQRQKKAPPRTKVYNLNDDAMCDICSLIVFGRGYKCATCFWYDVCPKCISNARPFHDPDLINDGKPHNLELDPADRDEYIDAPAVEEDSPASESEGSEPSAENGKPKESQQETKNENNDESDDDSIYSDD